MKIVIEAKVIKQAVVKFVVDDLILGSEYDTDTAKVVISKSGLAEVTIERKQPVLIDTEDIEDKGEEV